MQRTLELPKLRAKQCPWDVEGMGFTCTAAQIQQMIRSDSCIRETNDSAWFLGKRLEQAKCPAPDTELAGILKTAARRGEIIF